MAPKSRSMVNFMCVTRLGLAEFSLVFFISMGLSDCSPSHSIRFSTVGEEAKFQERPSLRVLGKKRDRRIGVGSINSISKYSDYSRRLIADEFDFLVPDHSMKWKWVHPNRGLWNFDNPDELVRFAQSHSQQVKGHALLWHGSLPDYVKRNPISWDDVRDHIETLMIRYRSHLSANGEKSLFAWDVVNEAIGDVDGNGKVALRDTIFKRYLGTNYVERVFALARATDPEALLIYNDYGMELPGPKSEFALAWLEELKFRKVPIDVIGFQMHIPLWKRGALEKFEANLKRYSDLGFQVTLSEIDVTLFSSEEEFRSMSEEQVNQLLEQQKKVYASLMRICLRNSKCIGLSPWGLNDSESWIRRILGKSYEVPVFFDEKLRKKPAYWGLHEALESP